jgi:uncharacterized membrane protein
MIKRILQGRFMDSPLHPMLVHLPVALWPLSLISDIAFFATDDAFFPRASYYLIGAGILGALLAALAGIAELVDVPKHTQARRVGLTHGALNILIASLYILSFLGRGNYAWGSSGTVTPAELTLNVISVGLLVVSGYLGSQLVFEHGVGLRTESKARDLDGETKKVA